MCKQCFDNECKGCRGVDHDRVRGQTVVCGMLESRKRGSFTCRPTPLIVWSSGKTSVQCVQIDLKHEHGIKHIDKLVGISGTTAEERYGMAVISREVGTKAGQGRRVERNGGTVGDPWEALKSRRYTATDADQRWPAEPLHPRSGRWLLVMVVQ